MDDPTPPPPQALSDCYRLLAACFCLPDHEVYLQEDVYADLERALSAVSPQAAAHAAEMGAAAASAEGEELRVEYARLFVGPHRLPAPPYGSVYLEPGRAVMGKSTLDARNQYMEEGLEPDAGVHEPPDHIAVELEFMYFLLSKEAAARAEGRLEDAEASRRRQLGFRRRLLDPWIDPFCRAIREHAQGAYFRSLADCLDTFIRATAA